MLLLLSCFPETYPDMVFTTIIAFAASLQVQTFRTVHGHTYVSTFTTGNLRALSKVLFNRFVDLENQEQAGRKAGVFAIICTGFLVGAAGGGVNTWSGYFCTTSFLAG